MVGVVMALILLAGRAPPRARGTRRSRRRPRRRDRRVGRGVPVRRATARTADSADADEPGGTDGTTPDPNPSSPTSRRPRAATTPSARRCGRHAPPAHAHVPPAGGGDRPRGAPRRDQFLRDRGGVRAGRDGVRRATTCRSAVTSATTTSCSCRPGQWHNVTNTGDGAAAALLDLRPGRAPARHGARHQGRGRRRGAPRLRAHRPSGCRAAGIRCRAAAPPSRAAVAAPWSAQGGEDAVERRRTAA